MARQADPDRSLARRALTAFELEDSLRRVATGLDSTYCVTSPNGVRTALRVAGPFDFRRPEALALEGAWIEALRDTPVAVPSVLRTRADSRVAVIEDDKGHQRGCLALGWLPGTKMRWRFTPRHAHALGRAAANLHGHAAAFRPPTNTWAKTWSAQAMCGHGSIETLENVAGARARKVVRAVEERLSAAAAELGDVDWHLINADLGPHNAVWRNGEPGLFDFNDSGWGYAGFDFARYLHGLRWRERGEHLVDAAIAGYATVRQFPPSWQTHGELFEVASGLFLARYLAPKIDGRGPATADTIVRLVNNTDRILDR